MCPELTTKFDTVTQVELTVLYPKWFCSFQYMQNMYRHTFDYMSPTLSAMQPNASVYKLSPEMGIFISMPSDSDSVMGTNG